MAEVSFGEADIRALASPEVYERGREYWHDGQVLELVHRGDELEATVQGSDDEPYVVLVALGSRGIVEAGCSCPYDWGGVCKHVVAALLAYLEQPEDIEQRPTLASRLAGLDRDALQ